jgi:hypothetical protein
MAKQTNTTQPFSSETTEVFSMEDIMGEVSMDEIMHTRLITRELIGGPKSPKGSLTKCSLRFRDLCYKLSSGSYEKEDIESTVLALKGEIKLLNLEMRKLKLVEMAMDADLLEYVELQSHIESSKESNKQDIMDLQQTLTAEKLVRRDKQEYEALAKMANALPSKRQTTLKLSAVQRDLDNLKGQEGQRDKELGIREKQFQLLLQCIFDLKSTLKEDEDNPDEDGNYAQTESGQALRST